MTNRKTTRRALVLSLLSLLVCCSMLVGTTFAWFTDSVQSGNNRIVAGNLDIELYYQNDETADWTKVDANSNIFKTGTLWEPGHTEVVKLKVVNEGTLALNYRLSVFVDSETGSVNKDGEAFKLSDYIKFGIVEGDKSYTREEAVSAVDATATALNVANNSEIIKLLPETDTNADNEDVVTMVVYMPEEVGNEANYGKGEAVPTIFLGLDLFATQVEAEFDSFGNDYDEDAWDDNLTVLSFAEFLTELENANYNYDGTDVKVVLKDSEYNHFNNTVRQYYIPSSTVNINSSLESLTIKNVVFTFEDDDTANNFTAGELQTLAKNVTFENCTFVNVSVSPWETKTGANDCESATFTDCTWKTLTGRYGIHQSKAAELTVTGCSFNSQRGIHVNTVDELTVKGNTFTGIGDGYGVLCLSEGITTTPTTLEVSGNTAAGQTMLRQLSKAVTLDQLNYILANNTYGKAYVSGSINHTVSVTPADVAALTVESGKKYALEGDFTGANVNIVMAKGVENVVFDGAAATGINELIITQDGDMIDGLNRIDGQRSGKVTVQNFTVASQIDLFACGTELEVGYNTAEALSVYAGNCALNIHHNVFDANFESHSIYSNATSVWSSNDYAVQLRIFKYDLKFDNNTCTDAKGHVVAINGYQGTYTTMDVDNKIESFSGNKITVNSTTNSNRACFKVWADNTYAPQDNQNAVNADAQAFIDMALAGGNTFTVDGATHTYFCIYNVNTNN